MFYIYKITNLINGKHYVGRTSNLKERWSKHLSGREKSLIARAIKKYNKDNFTFEVLDSCNCKQEIKNMEEFYIKFYNSINPNGYNLTSYSRGCIIMHPETKKKISLSNLGRKSSNTQCKFLGLNYDSFGGKIRIILCVIVNGKRVRRNVSSEIQGANLYDQIMLLHYGDNVKINFEENRYKYSKLELQEFFNIFLNKMKCNNHQIYEGIILHRKSNKWQIKVDGKIKLGLWDDPLEAAKIRDKFIICFDLNDKINFPELVESYNKEDLITCFSEKRYKKFSRKGKTSLHKHISYCKAKNRWVVRFEINKKKFCGYAKTEEEALQLRNIKIKELDLPMPL